MKTALLTILASLFALGVAADPRWWRHDALLTDPTNLNAKAHPDVAIVTGTGTSGGAAAIYATWDEVNSTGATDVLLTASFDGGCTWCGPVVWANSIDNETRPRVAAGVSPTDRLSVQVVYERNGNSVWVAGDASIAVNDPPAAKCTAFGRLATPVPVLLGSSSTRPRIASANQQSAPRSLHFHAVWQNPNGIQHGRDLAGDGSGWGTTPPSRPGAGATPDVAADVVGTAAADSGVTITAIDAGVAQMFRSADSGGTWLPPVVVSGQATAQVVPVIDSSTAGFEGQVWNGITWQDATSDQITFDAAYWTDPVTRVPDFEATPVDHPASTQANTPGIAPAVSVAAAAPGGLAGGTPFFTFWQTDATPIEVVSRGGELSNFNPTVRDLSVFPFRAPGVPSRVAPPDNPVSEVRAHSNCLWDDDWLGGMTMGRCDVQPRTGNGAVEVASADGLSFPAIFATVFADDRTGTSQIYFKITDTRVSPPTLRSFSGSCQGLQRVDGQAIFLPVAQCGSGAAPAPDERMDRYLLYYGSQTSQTPPASNSGPFLSRVERPASMSSPIPVAGLRPLETYHFYLIGEDEARNISPMSFNPLVSGNIVAGNVVQWLTAQVPGPCEPNFDYNCGAPTDSCGGLSDGVFALGETVTMTVFLTNIGDWSATNLTGRVNVGNATVVSPPGGVFNIPGPIGLTSTVQVDITLRLPSVCPPVPTVGLTLDMLQSDGGVVTFGPFSCGNVLTLDCSSMCNVASCLTANLSAIRELKGVKDGAGGATFSWLPDPSPDVIEYHLNTVTVKTDLVEPNVHLPLATLQCTPTPLTATMCTDPNAIGDGTLLFYQVFSACGSTGADEGPFFP